MKVSLISYTQAPEDVCDFASMTCVSESMDGEYGIHPEHKSMKSAIKSGHLSVLEHASFTFYIEGISRACSHQLVRHRLASYSQQSQRYVDMDDFEYVMPKSIRDSYDKMHSMGAEVCFIRAMEYLQNAYEELVEACHIPPEDARYLLPNACKTNIVVTMNARELIHFFSLRLCNRAQWEIREMATLMLEEVRKVAPALFETAGPACARGPCPEGKRSCGHPWKEFNDYKFEEKAEDDEPRRTKVGDDPVLDLQRWEFKVKLLHPLSQEGGEGIIDQITDWEKEDDE